MSIINIGNADDDGLGDSLRDAGRKMNRIIGGPATSITTDAGSASTTLGILYIVPASATGDFAGEDNKLAYYNGSAWEFYTPATGFEIWVADESARYRYSGSAWSVASGAASVTGTRRFGMDDPTAYSDALGADEGFDQEFDGSGASLPAGWAWFNQDTADFVQQFGYGAISNTGGADASDVQGAVMDLEGNEWTADMHLSAVSDDATGYSGMVVLRDSASGGLVMLGMFSPLEDDTPELYLIHWDDADGTNEVVIGGPYTFTPGLSHDAIFRVVKNSNTDYDFQVSPTGGPFIPLATAVDLSTYISPDQIGFGLNTEGVGNVACEWLRVRGYVAVVKTATSDDAEVELQLVFDQTSGTTAFTDESLKGRTITANGAPATDGTGLVLNGTNQWLTVDDGDDEAFQWLLSGDEWTYEAWFIGRPSNSLNVLFSTDIGSSSNRGIFCAIQSDGTLRLTIERANAGNYLLDQNGSNFVVPNDSAEHHFVMECLWDENDRASYIAVSLDGGDVQVFPMASIANDEVSIGAHSEFGAIGATNSGGSHFNGTLTGIRLTRGRRRYNLKDNAGGSVATVSSSSIKRNLSMDQYVEIGSRGLFDNPDLFWDTINDGTPTIYTSEPLFTESSTEGTVHAFFAQGSAHSADTVTSIWKVTSTDYGATWDPSTLVQVATDATFSCRNHAIIRDPVSGRLVVFFRTTNASDQTQDVYFVTSTDEGATWSARASVNSQLSATLQGLERAGWGPGVVTSQGMVMPFYGSGHCDLLFSSDGGLSWGSVVTAYTGQTNRNEPSIVVHSDTNQVALVPRRDNSSSDERDFSVLTSSDGGLTWGSLTDATKTSGGTPNNPNPIRLCNANGTIQAVWCSREEADNGIYLTEMDEDDFFAAPSQIITGTGNATETEIAKMVRFEPLNTGSNENGYGCPVFIEGERTFVSWNYGPQTSQILALPGYLVL